ncbi:MAG: DUF2752 domain-containing protein [Flavobacterium sp.]|nr:MAG: DUF2752 domain-containing protein [Flavobacterium sp.]
MTRNRLYAVMGLACAAGYSWLFYSLASDNDPGNLHLCFFKSITGIPCPSCGTTRSVSSLVHGDLVGAIQMNPLGIIVSAIMAVLPFWLVADLISQSSSLWKFYHQVEEKIKKPPIALTLAALVLINWIWNIIKNP